MSLLAEIGRSGAQYVVECKGIKLYESENHEGARLFKDAFNSGMQMASIFARGESTAEEFLEMSDQLVEEATGDKYGGDGNEQA